MYRRPVLVALAALAGVAGAACSPDRPSPAAQGTPVTATAPPVSAPVAPTIELSPEVAAVATDLSERSALGGRIAAAAASMLAAATGTVEERVETPTAAGSFTLRRTTTFDRAAGRQSLSIDWSELEALAGSDPEARAYLDADPWVSVLVDGDDVLLQRRMADGALRWFRVPGGAAEVLASGPLGTEAAAPLRLLAGATYAQLLDEASGHSRVRVDTADLAGIEGLARTSVERRLRALGIDPGASIELDVWLDEAGRIERVAYPPAPTGHRLEVVLSGFGRPVRVALPDPADVTPLA